MGDAFGKDVFKYGSDDWQARKIYEESKAERHPPVSPSSNDWSSSNLPQNSPSTYSHASSGGSSLGKFLLFAVAGVALMGYFSSESDKSSSPEERFRAQRDAYEAQSIGTTPATTTTPTPSSSSYSAAPETTTPAPQPVASTSRLPENDQRVTAAVNDVQAVSRVTMFVAGGGDMLVVERQLPTPQQNLTQTRFNVGDLDLHGATFAADNGNLNIPCKQNAVCVAYNVYEGSTEQTAGALREHNSYTSVSMWSASTDDANRILQDLLQLQNLQQ